MTAKAVWYFTSRIAATRAISTSVGSTLNSMKVSKKLMPREPRSMSRETPPVWRSRWKRSARRCRWRKTCRATQRIARDVELIDDAFQHQRDGDGSGLGQDQAAYGPQHPGAVFPEVGEEAADGLQVAT